MENQDLQSVKETQQDPTNKNAVQKFAQDARVALNEGVRRQAFYYGVTAENWKTVDPDAATVDGRLLSANEWQSRRKLIDRVREIGFEQTMEEAAYGWFNRLIALRYMEVNNYLPSRVRVFTDASGAFRPEILDAALEINLPGLNRERVIEAIENNETAELYRYLLLLQCNALSEVLPRLFEPMGGYIEILLPTNVLSVDGVVGKMIAYIPEKYWLNQVQIVGWLYQYYIYEQHKKVVSINKSAIPREDIPAATQLFTPEWIVKYLVDNTLGRYWIERCPESKLAEKLEFFVKPKSGEITYVEVDKTLEPQEVTFLEPCVGSGHFLVYAFDVLMEIYKERGYSERNAATEIVRHNLFGLDIDNRCAQLAYFAVMMKALQYDRRFLTRGVEPQVYSPLVDPELMELGSLVSVDKLEKKPEPPKERVLFYQPEKPSLFSQNYDEILNDWNYRRLLAQKYAVVCTNPPYLNKYNPKLKKFVTDRFKDYSGDLFSIFVFRCFDFCQKDGYSAFMTPFVWMFIKTYEKLRLYIVAEKSLVSIVQMEYSAYEEATVPLCAFILKNDFVNGTTLGFRLSEFKGGMKVQCQKVLEAIANPDCDYFYEADQANFAKIPGAPIAYWVSEAFFSTFNNDNILKVCAQKTRISTSDNDRFMRKWFEIYTNRLFYPNKWIPCPKGGDFRKWYGNIDVVLNWENEGAELRAFHKASLGDPKYFLQPGITWTVISSKKTGFRLVPEGCICDHKGPLIYVHKQAATNYLMGLLNSKFSEKLLEITAPTIGFEWGAIAKTPWILDSKREYVEKLVTENIALSKADWDAFETSWDFARHPLVGRSVATVAEAFAAWEAECDERFRRLKANEEELNRIFIDIYGLADELTPEVDDKDVTVRRADLVRDIKSLISYAVGCMFGRYSLVVDGLAYAGGDWDASKYGPENKEGEKQTFKPDEDAIIPICDDDYFKDDATTRFVEWLKFAFGAEKLDENLRFIADALGGDGKAPKETIRDYFLNGFYKDHVQTYQKRPIYWLFDSGKKNGFKALLYVHRYRPDAIARLRVKYVHELQGRYRAQLESLDGALEAGDLKNSERAALNKRKKKLDDQAHELRKYEEKVRVHADAQRALDLDDGVKSNYALFDDILAPIK